jgi:lysophospholipase L1-like esterase
VNRTGTSLRSRLLLGFASLFVALAAAEAWLRSGPSQRGVDLAALHETQAGSPWLYRLRPGAELSAADGIRYRINAEGFRDRPRARPKPAGVYRVIVLGDSIAFGYGVSSEDAFPARLERGLARAGPTPRIEVLNFGVNGYNPYNEAALVEQLAPVYGPDLVLVQFCVNDLNDPTLHFDASTAQTLGALPALAFPNPGARLPPAPEHGAARRACAPQDLCARMRALLRRAWPAFDAATVAATFAPRDGAEHVVEWSWLRERYAGIAATAASRGARFGVIVFPYAGQLERGDAALAQPELARLGAEHGWETIDLLRAFRDAQARGGGPLLFDLWHPTAAGQAVAAEAIGRELVCRGLVPVAPGPACGKGG